MKRWLLLGIAGVACGETPRTELLVGVATDIKAPGIIDGAQLVVTRVDNGQPVVNVAWTISGIPNEPVNLPGSYGIYSDGEEVKLDFTLVGLRGTNEVVTRKAVLNLVEDKTLFFRMGLTAGCIDKNDCTDTQSCVEGACVDREINSLQLPDFEPELVTKLSCTPGAQYIDTATGEAMDPTDDAADCPPDLCVEGTCLKPPPPQTEPRTITGSKITTFIQPNAFANQAANLSQAAPSALIPDGAGGYTTIAGRGTSEGTFVIENVPAGPYILKDGTDYYATSSNTFDLGGVAQGSPDAVPVTSTTSIDLNVSNMSPFAATDTLEAVSPNVNDWWFAIELALPTLNIDDTAVSGTISTDLAKGGKNLIENDPFTLIHLGSKQATGGGIYLAATQAFRPAPFTQTDGATTTINGAFVDLPQTNTLAATIRPSPWYDASGFDGTQLAALGPGVIAPSSVFYIVHAQMGGTVYGKLGPTADLILGDVPRGPDVALDGVTFGYPFPLSEVWGKLFTATLDGSVSYQLPNTTNPATLPVGVEHTQALGSINEPVAPTLGPVRSPTIDGRDLFQPQASLPETPTLAWQPPALGTPTQYVVSVFELTVNGANTKRTRVARLFTTETRIAAPSGIFVDGHTYALQIRATNTPNPTAPNRFRLPTANATVASAILGIGAPRGTVAECGACVIDQDCLRGTCSNNVCIAAPTTVTTSMGNMVPGYVRDDGAILLAHYAAGSFHTAYDPGVTQELTTSGGVTPPAGWVPDPCRESGHMSFAEWNPTGRGVVLECGTAPDAIMGSFESSSLFTSFASNSYGTVGASGTPGWAMVAAIGSGQGRSNHASCGGVTDPSTGGIAYCAGPGVPNSFSNHLVSFFVSTAAASNHLGCMGMGCNGPTCPLQVWVWLK